MDEITEQLERIADYLATIAGHLDELLELAGEAATESAYDE
jgi:hypothetical protein